MVKKIEICRTTSEKTISDLFRCTKLSENTKIIFIDDIYHPKMKNKNVKYIYIKPYIYDYPFNIMIEHFYLLNKKYIKNKKIYNVYMNRYISRYNYENISILTKKELNQDNMVSEQILRGIIKFLK